MNRRTALALTIGLSSIGLLAGNRIGHAQQSDADKVKTAIDGFHTAISSLDIRKMDDVWASRTLRHGRQSQRQDRDRWLGCNQEEF